MDQTKEPCKITDLIKELETLYDRLGPDATFDDFEEGRCWALKMILEKLDKCK